MDPKTFRPLHKTIFVIPDELFLQQTASGLFITSQTEDSTRPWRGEVIAVAEDVTSVKVGDHVIFGKSSGKPLEYSSDPKATKVLSIDIDNVMATYAAQ